MPPSNRPVQRLSRGSSLAEQAYSEVKASIVSGTMDSDVRYAEAALARTLGISRTPLREALRRLEQEGFVTTQGLQGLTVVPVTPESVRELYDVRCALETLAAFRAARLIPLAAIESMRRRHARTGEALAAGDSKPFHESEFPFHDLFVQNCGNGLLIRNIERLRDQLDRVVQLSTRLLEHTLDSYAEHGEILDAMETRDPHVLEHAVRRHINGVAVRIGASIDIAAQHEPPRTRSVAEPNGDPSA